MFFGHEGKDVKQQKFFTVNNKQYMIHSNFVWCSENEIIKTHNKNPLCMAI